MFMLLSLPIFSIELGEYMEVDGIPSIVIYVDQTGQHGMVMSATTFSEENRKSMEKMLNSKKWKKKKEKLKNKLGIIIPDFEAAYLEMPTLQYEDFVENTLELDYSGLKGLTSEYGKENARILADYCADNQLDIEKYFPDQAWANSLGEGWYIPGNAELELYAAFLGKEIGEAHKESIFKIDMINSLWYPGSTERFSRGYDVAGSTQFKQFFIPLLVKSSTMTYTDWTASEENSAKLQNIDVEKMSKWKTTHFYIFGTWFKKRGHYFYWLAFGAYKKRLNANLVGSLTYYTGPSVVAVKEI